MAGSIVCGVDDSTVSRVALRFARRLAERLDLRLVLVHVAEVRPAPNDPLGAYAPLPVDPDESRMREAGRALVQEIAAGEELDEVTVRSELGDPADQIVAVAKAEDAAIVVVGSRGRGPLAAGLLGSVSSGVASHAAGPVLVVPPEAEPGSGEPGAILCGVDESEGSRAALRGAARLAERLGARLVLAHAAAPPGVLGVAAVPGASEEMRSREIAKAESLLSELAVAAGLGKGVDRRIEFGAAADVLDRVAEEERAGLIVVGSRGRFGIKAALLGSTSAALPARARVPVMIVPPTETDRLGQEGGLSEPLAQPDDG